MSERRQRVWAGAALVFLLLMAVMYWMATRPADQVTVLTPPAPAAPTASVPTPTPPSQATAPTKEAPVSAPTREELRAELERRLQEATPSEPDDDPLPALVVAVTVTDDTGEPLRRVPVTIQHSTRNRPLRFFTDAAGRLEQRLDAGVLVVTAERADGMLRSRSEPVHVDGRTGGRWSVELVISSEPKAGLGVNIAPSPDGVRILAVHAGTPAEAAGLESGDVVTAVEGTPTKGMPLADFVEQMTGPAGTKVLFDVLRPDGSEERLQVERELLQAHREEVDESDDEE